MKATLAVFTTRQRRTRLDSRTDARDYRRLQNRRRRPYEQVNSRLGGTARIPVQAANARHYRSDALAWIDYR